MERFHVTRHLPKMVHMTKPRHFEQPENKYFVFFLFDDVINAGLGPLPVGNLHDD